MAEIESKDARTLAGVELNALALAGVFPKERLAGAEVSAQATPVYDITGAVLFHRLPVERGREQLGAADVAADPVMGDVLIAYADGMIWNPDALTGEAREVARRRGYEVDGADEARFVAYSYPKLGVQFLRAGEEIVLLELFTWEPVPPAGAQSKQSKERKPLEPENFERWSLIEELPATQRRSRAKRFHERLRSIGELKIPRRVYEIDPDVWRDILVFQLVETREIRYSLRTSHHTPCYELRGQETNVWCVGASSQMLLDFYRYEYTQDRLAQELGLGTKSNPNGLPYSQVAHVVTALEALTGNGLDVTMITDPTFATFRNEIRANRPLISFVPGHSRTVAGFTETRIPVLFGGSNRGLLVYDPWPPNAGVITRWENFATQTYQYAYTAEVTKI